MISVTRGSASLTPDQRAGQEDRGQAKRHQVRQVANLVRGYALHLEDQERTDYRIEVTWSAEHRVWVADVPDLPYCSAHGATPHEAVAEVEWAALAWLDAAQRTGRPVPPPSAPAFRA